MTADRRNLRARNRQLPRHLGRVPDEEWGNLCPAGRAPFEVWRSRAYLVLLYVDQGHLRMSVIRAQLAAGGGWQEGISWDDLQRLKRECGRGDTWAVECYPPDGDVVNVANMRHLWLLPDPPAYGWHKS